jgi:hypothetical protein
MPCVVLTVAEVGTHDEAGVGDVAVVAVLTAVVTLVVGSPWWALRSA